MTKQCDLTMKKSVFLVIALITLLAPALFSPASAEETVRVKEGDWIKYQVTETGNPTSDFNITWARMDITGVKGETIYIDVVTAYANGTIYPENGITLNLATGAIGDGFFIPTNLNPGDKYNSEYEGNITITGVEQLETGGAERAVLSGVANQTTYYWDKQTGIMVAATSNFNEFSMFTKTSQTNLWQPQILGLDSTVFYVLLTAIMIILVAFSAISIWRLKLHREK
ncbi:MAG: hypothetical protein ABSA79_08210 [Candidatus Bathyarchaeia archaeon]|jgi:hypothetical protein